LQVQTRGHEQRQQRT
jgi:hypothetical protein